MQKEMTPEIGASCLDPVKHDEEFPLTAQVKKLPRDLARFAFVVTLRDIGRRIGVVRTVLESDDVAALAGQSLAFINVTQQTAIILIFLRAPKFFVRIKDCDDIE